jgi:hypothetical protein
MDGEKYLLCIPIGCQLHQAKWIHCLCVLGTVYRVLGNVLVSAILFFQTYNSTAYPSECTEGT